MNKCNIIILLLLPAISVIQAQDFYTSPAKWKTSRNFHTQSDKKLLDSILIAHVNRQCPDSAIVSPNNGYSFLLKRTQIKNRNMDKWELSICNEKDSVIQIQFRNAIAVEQPKWINEKLLFLRIWWGRVLGTDLVYDVEKETIIYNENCNDGSLALQQFKQIQKKKSP